MIDPLSTFHRTVPSAPDPGFATLVPPVIPAAGTPPDAAMPPSTETAPEAETPPVNLFDPERLEAQEEALWHGRRIADLSDDELAAVVAGSSDEPAPEPPPARSPANWRKLAVTWPEPRVSLTLRVDESVVAWFRRSGRDHRARMNAVLRAYVDAQRAGEEKRRR
ncbi:MAG: BrnA antitoxin family protein [Rhodospirillales bacterium]|nr:BrnA antitoxin family protein [Rhodospirillales bacterium]